MARKMKDSGIEWIGEIPEDWKVVRMKSCIQSRISGSWGDNATGGCGDVICLRVADFDYNNFKFKDTQIEQLTVRNYDDDTINKLSLKHGDILIEKSGGGEKTPVGRTVIFNKEYKALYANFMDRLRCSCFIYPNFMQYIFVTFYKNNYTKNYIKQTTGIQNLDLTSMLAKELVAIPNLSEQQRIADFLDQKCAQIDEILQKTRDTIAEYKKLKQSIITQAVTKGVRGERPMKDSGIEWIGEIPEEWDVRKVGYFFDIQLGKMVQPVQINPDDTLENYLCAVNLGGNILKMEPLKQMWFNSYEKNNLSIKKDDLLVVEGGDIASCDIVYYDVDGLYFQNALHRVRSKNNSNTHFLKYWLWMAKYRGYIDLICNKATIAHFSKEKFINLPFVICKLNEQQEIAQYLDQKCAEIDKLIEKKEQLVNELESYKKSLIYEYVTGKKEVVI